VADVDSYLDDRVALEDLIIRYTYLLDFEGTVDDLVSLFTEDASLRGPYMGRHEGASAIREWAAKSIGMREAGVHFRHYVSNFRAQIDGDHADFTVFLQMHYRQELYGGGVQLTKWYMGDYVCSARRVDGKWLLTRREVRLDPT